MGAGRHGVAVSSGNGLGGGESGLVVADAACGGGTGVGWGWRKRFGRAWSGPRAVVGQ